jgi:hypothetical protein
MIIRRDNDRSTHPDLFIEVSTSTNVQATGAIPEPGRVEINLAPPKNIPAGVSTQLNFPTLPRAVAAI